MAVSAQGGQAPIQVDLLAIVVAGDQTDQLFQRLNAERFCFTVIDSAGGLLQESAVCLLIGLEQTRLEELFASIQACCHTRRQFIPTRLEAAALPQPVMIEAEVGGATVYVLKVERFEQI